MNMEEIKEAVKNLSREDLGVFRKWFWESIRKDGMKKLKMTSRRDVLIPFCGKSTEIPANADCPHILRPCLD
jgi:hypothetical protein